MAGGTRRACVLAMSLMAGKATEALVNSNGGAIVAGTDLHERSWSVALVAEGLPLVGTDLH